MRLDLEPVRRAPGVALVLTADDVPGVNDVSPTHRHDEPLLATTVVEYAGQPLFAVAAETRDQARRAARLAVVEYEELPALLDVEAARPSGRLVTEPLTLRRGDAAAALAAAPHRIEGRSRSAARTISTSRARSRWRSRARTTRSRSTPRPSTRARSSTWWRSCWACPTTRVTVECRRMGGGFGGKETQGNLFACIAALVAKKTGRAAKIRPDRDDDMVITGKRHDFVADYAVGFDDGGPDPGRRHDLCRALRLLRGSVRAGHRPGAVPRRQLLLLRRTSQLRSLPLKTNTVSNTAFRGFGGPQGMVAGERLIEEIAFALRQGPARDQEAQFYGEDERNVTPYHQTIEDNVAARDHRRARASADYWGRREAIRAHNANSRVIKRGLALTPVKFGISFTATQYNQAGALVHVYTDGSIHLNHGGTEMGQGLYTKVAQVVAEEFQVDLDQVRITATTTGKVPNTSATAASSGSDLNGMAAQAAARTIKARLVAFAAEHWEVPAEQVVFLPGRVRVGNQEILFRELVWQAYMARVSLSSTGFYKTPKIHWDRASGRGQPFYYFAYGAAWARSRSTR